MCRIPVQPVEGGPAVRPRARALLPPPHQLLLWCVLHAARLAHLRLSARSYRGPTSLKLALLCLAPILVLICARGRPWRSGPNCHQLLHRQCAFIAPPVCISSCVASWCLAMSPPHADAFLLQGPSPPSAGRRRATGSADASKPSFSAACLFKCGVARLVWSCSFHVLHDDSHSFPALIC